MKEELIKFETAKLAKEKGFNIPIVTFFNTVDNWVSYKSFRETEENLHHAAPTYSSFGNIIWRPTQSLLQKWLREVHNIHIVIWWYDNTDQFYYNIGFKTKEGIKRVQSGNTNLLFNAYEQALEKGLQEALKLIK